MKVLFRQVYWSQAQHMVWIEPASSGVGQSCALVESRSHFWTIRTRIRSNVITSNCKGGGLTGSEYNSLWYTGNRGTKMPREHVAICLVRRVRVDRV